MKKIELKIKVEEIAELREVVSKSDSLIHKVADVLIGDETGCIYLSVWDEQIMEIQKGKHYLISNAYTTTYKSALTMSLGKYGKIQEIEANFEINTSNNVSLKEL